MYEFFRVLVLANGLMNSVAKGNEQMWVGGFEIKTCWGKSTSSLTILYMVHRQQ